MSWRVAYSALNYANTLTFKGELAQARGLVWEAIESGVTTATFKTKAAAVGIPLALLLNDRRLLEACSDDAALAFAARSGEPQRIAAVTAAFAALRTAQGSGAQAGELLERAFEAISRPHRCVSLLLHVAASNDPKARLWVERTFASALLRPRIRRALRLLLSALTPGVAANESHIARLAATACARVGWRLHETHAIEAAGNAREAHGRYVQMGDVRDAARVAGTLEATGLAGSGLSPRQVQIAQLVADGETNRGIAQRLHISEHTVEHHLSTIFTRLGLRSRSALAAYVGRSAH
jgi:DNA-binding CsgD family transcriptional regulator